MFSLLTRLVLFESLWVVRRKTLTRDLALCPLCPLCPLLSPECMEFSALCPFLRLLFLPDAFFFLHYCRENFWKLKGRENKWRPFRSNTRSGEHACSYSSLWLFHSSANWKNWAIELQIHCVTLDSQSIELIIPDSPFYCFLGCLKFLSVFLTSTAFGLFLGPVKTSVYIS